MYKLILLICLLLSNQFSTAQHTTYYFDNYTSKDGLPSMEVYSVFRDRDNYLWFATDHGVCRYDGYTFQKIPLPDNTVFHIRQDKDGLVWFGTYTGQLFYLKNDKVYPYWYNNIILEQFKNLIITDFTVARDSSVYLAFMTASDVRIDSKGRFTRGFSKNILVKVQQFDSVFFTSVNHSGERIDLPIGIEIETPQKHLYNTIATGNLFARKQKAIRSFNGNYIVFAGKFLFVVDNKGQLKTHEMPFEILSVFEDSSGDLWVGSIYNGLLLMEWDINKGYVIREKYLDDYSITDIMQDHEGGMWFTSLEKGVFYLRSKYLYFLSPAGSKLDFRIQSLAVMQDSLLLIGSKGKGVHLFNPQKAQLTSINAPGNFDNMYFDTESGYVIAVGSDFGEYKVEHALKKDFFGAHFLLTEGNSNIIKGGKGAYLLGKHSGLFTLDQTTGLFTRLNDETFRVGWMQRDNSGNIITANQYGLWKFSGKSFIPYDTSQPLLSKRITCIQFFQGEILCLGTRGEGFLIKIKDSVFRIAEEQGLVNNNIRKILVRNNDILLATNKGLSKLKILSLVPFRYTITNLGYSEGLFVSEVNDICWLKDVLYIASDIGLAFIDENNALGSKSSDLPFHFTQIRINDSPVPWQPHYELNYKQRDIAIAYTGLSFRDPAGIQYRYRIKGLDTSWSVTSAREIRLTSMPYGNYTIEFQAGDRSGKWFPSIRSLDISIIPPIWKRQWFVVLLVVVIAGLVFWWTRRKINVIKEREREKTVYNKRVAEMEIRSLRAQMNPHFTFNVMQSIQYYITHHDFDSAQRYLGKFSKLMRRVLDNSRFAYITLFDEIETLKDYLDLEKLRFENELDYSIHIQPGIDPHMISIPTMLIQPYVENAVKHGLASKKNNPRVEIVFHIKDGNLIAEIRDNGIGRAKAAEMAHAINQKHISAGTSLVADRIEAFNKYYGYTLKSETFDLYDDQDKATGTKVELTIPLDLSYDKSTSG